MKPQEYIMETSNFVFDSIVQQKQKEGEQKWFCDVCNKEVKVLEIHVPNGPDDNDLGEIVCAECGTTLWED